MKQEKNKVQNNKNHKLGFTLLELLVVVLIIGILAAIALPQYKKVVMQSKYNALKSIVRNIADSANRFYLANNRYPYNYQELDLDFKINFSEKGDTAFAIGFSNVRYCTVWFSGWNRVMCVDKIIGKNMRYYMLIVPQKPSICLAESMDKTDVHNKLCQKETNKTSEQASCIDYYCLYYY